MGKLNRSSFFGFMKYEFTNNFYIEEIDKLDEYKSMKVFTPDWSQFLYREGKSAPADLIRLAESILTKKISKEKLSK